MDADCYHHTDIGGSSWPLLFWPWLVEETSSRTVVRGKVDMAGLTTYRVLFAMKIIPLTNHSSPIFRFPSSIFHYQSSAGQFLDSLVIFPRPIAHGVPIATRPLYDRAAFMPSLLLLASSIADSGVSFRFWDGGHTIDGRSEWMTLLLSFMRKGLAGLAFIRLQIKM